MEFAALDFLHNIELINCRFIAEVTAKILVETEEVDNKAEIGLLISLKSGDRAAFGQIYKLYSLRIYWNILKMVKSEDDAKELLQDVFLKVWEKRALLDPLQSFRSYLFQISKFTVYNFIRKNNLEKKLKDYLSQENSELYTHVEELLSYKQSDAFIQEAIEQLPPQRKQIYKLCKIEGKSYEEVSKMMGISTSTISDHIVKATKFIKNKHSSIDSAIVVIAISVLFENL